MRSLKSQLMISVLLVLSLVIGGSGAALYLLVRHHLEARFDAALVERTIAVAEMVEQDPIEGLRVEWEDYENSLPEALEDEELLQVWRADAAAVFARSPQLTSEDLPRFGDGGDDGDEDEAEIRAIVLPDGRRARAAGLRFVADRDEDLSDDVADVAMQIVLARTTTDLHQTMRAFLGILLTVYGLGMAISVAGVLLIVRRTGGAIAGLTGQLAAVDEAVLSTRFEDAHVPRELVPVVERLNAMMTGIEASFAREKQFTANAAHELRTPLAGLRSQIEVALSQPRTEQAYQETLGRCLTISRQMQSLAENLLSLARLESGEVAVTRQPLELIDALHVWWSPYAKTAEARGLTVVWDCPPELDIRTDEAMLRVVLGNLFDNAVTYGSPAAPIRIVIPTGTQAVSITIANGADNLSVEQVEHLFEPFWSADGARAVGAHAGLGLAICKRIMALLGGRIDAALTPDRELRIEITLGQMPG